MSTKTWLVRILIMCVATGVLAACAADSGDTNLTPASPAVATAAAPATASAGGTSNSFGNTLAAALGKTRGATVYRIDFNSETGSIVGGQTKTQPFLVFEGEINGDSNHITYNGGAFTEMLGGGSRVEMISIENKTYMRGSNFFGAADPEHWYFLPDSAITKPPFDVQDILQLTGGDVSQAQPSGTSSLDGQDCQVWRLDFRSQAGPLMDLATTPDTKDSFSVVDTAEAQYSPCADGYVHAMQWSVTSHAPADAADKATIGVSIHLYDFNASNIVISVPANAIEMK